MDRNKLTILVPVKVDAMPKCCSDIHGVHGKPMKCRFAHIKGIYDKMIFTCMLDPTIDFTDRDLFYGWFNKHTADCPLKKNYNVEQHTLYYGDGSTEVITTQQCKNLEFINCINCPDCKSCTAPQKVAWGDPEPTPQELGCDKCTKHYDGAVSLELCKECIKLYKVQHGRTHA